MPILCYLSINLTELYQIAFQLCKMSHFSEVSSFFFKFSIFIINSLIDDYALSRGIRKQWFHLRFD